MHDDDLPHGRLYPRREVLALLGSALFVRCGGDSRVDLGFGDGAGVCVISPELAEGPFFVDERLNRSDIREDRAGALLVLTLGVIDGRDRRCTALAGASVDVWHADAQGRYSDIASQGTAGQTFLRGFQVTDGRGEVAFSTIYPGWYPGRAVHLHFKVRIAGREFTSQFFFDDAVTDTVYAANPVYNTRGARDTRNPEDSLFRAGGDELVLPVFATASGYAASFDIVVA